MIGKARPMPTPSEELNVLLERSQSIPGKLPSGRIELVGTRLGKVAAAVIPNGSLNTVHMLVVDEQLDLLTTHMAFTRFDGKPHAEILPRTSRALFGVAAKEMGGFEQWPLFRRERRHEVADLKDTLTILANSGSTYDPFQNSAVACHLVAAVKIHPQTHPAFVEAIASL